MHITLLLLFLETHTKFMLIASFFFFFVFLHLLIDCRLAQALLPRQLIILIAFLQNLMVVLLADLEGICSKS
jgi:hypothetical protein